MNKRFKPNFCLVLKDTFKNGIFKDEINPAGSDKIGIVQTNGLWNADTAGMIPGFGSSGLDCLSFIIPQKPEKLSKN